MNDMVPVRMKSGDGKPTLMDACVQIFLVASKASSFRKKNRYFYTRITLHMLDVMTTRNQQHIFFASISHFLGYSSLLWFLLHNLWNQWVPGSNRSVMERWTMLSLRALHVKRVSLVGGKTQLVEEGSRHIVMAARCTRVWEKLPVTYKI